MNENRYPNCHNPILPRYGGGGVLGEPPIGLSYACFSCMACKTSDKTCTVGSKWIAGGDDKECCDRWPLFRLLTWLWGESLTEKAIIENFMAQAYGDQKLFNSEFVEQAVGVHTLFELSDSGAMELYNKCKESRRHNPFKED